MAYKVNNGRLYPVTGPEKNRDKGIGGANGGDGNFRQLLKKTIERKPEIKISAHALRRLDQRNLKLTDNDMKNLETAMDKVEAKGARESLMLYKEMAFVASVRNRTIITAVGQKDAKENVFTNIDSAVIIDED
ncbi:MAG TPA: TIGR02530 family flagellar biosynthesis protein [Clostridia bacterium]|nr:TIGR02530 family flagellar biosynthesis protein [Clostridia bacterium]